MGYMRDLEQELRGLLTDLPAEQIEPLVKFVKDRVYDSYRNGCDSGTKKTQPGS